MITETERDLEPQCPECGFRVPIVHSRHNPTERWARHTLTGNLTDDGGPECANSGKDWMNKTCCNPDCQHHIDHHERSGDPAGGGPCHFENCTCEQFECEQALKWVARPRRHPLSSSP